MRRREFLGASLAATVALLMPGVVQCQEEPLRTIHRHSERGLMRVRMKVLRKGDVFRVISQDKWCNGYWLALEDGRDATDADGPHAPGAGIVPVAQGPYETMEEALAAIPQWPPSLPSGGPMPDNLPSCQTSAPTATPGL